MGRKKKQRILAIDPGSKILGYAIFYGKKLTTYGHLKTKTTMDKYQKIRYMVENLELIISDNDPIDMAVVEEFFNFSRRKGSATVPEVKGALFYVINLWNIPIEEINPRSVKKSITGNGNATKTMVKNAVIGKYTVEGKPCQDTFDAIAIGDTYLNNGA